MYILSFLPLLIPLCARLFYMETSAMNLKLNTMCKMVSFLIPTFLGNLTWDKNRASTFLAIHIPVCETSGRLATLCCEGKSSLCIKCTCIVYRIPLPMHIYVYRPIATVVFFFYWATVALSQPCRPCWSVASCHVFLKLFYEQIKMMTMIKYIDRQRVMHTDCSL